MDGCPLWGSFMVVQMDSWNSLYVTGICRDFLMANQRKGDLEPYNKFRIDRFIKDGGEWYFFTREGAMQGPFEVRFEAENRLEEYVKVMASGLLPDTELSIEPLG